MRRSGLLAALVLLVLAAPGKRDRIAAQEVQPQPLPIAKPAPPSASSLSATPSRPPAELKWSAPTRSSPPTVSAPQTPTRPPLTQAGADGEPMHAVTGVPDDALPAPAAASDATAPAPLGVKPQVNFKVRRLRETAANAPGQMGLPAGETSDGPTPSAPSSGQAATSNKPPIAPLPQEGSAAAPEPAGPEAGGGVRPLVPQPLPQAAESHAAAASPADHPPASGRPPNLTPAGAQTPSLYLEKIGPPALNQGRPLSYVIVLRNPGAATVFNVRVEDGLPAGANFLRADPRPEIQDRLLVWPVGSLEPGAERRFQVEVQPAGEGEHMSCATATFSVATCLRTRVTLPRLAIQKTGPPSVQVGDSAVFQIQVTNSGTGPATNVVLHDRLPPGLRHPHGSDIEADLGTLEPGQTRNVTLETTAVQAGRHVNQAVATADDGLQAMSQAVVTVTEPMLVLRKTGPQHRFLNREAEFELELSNPGTAAATGVRLVDTLPPGLEFVSASDFGVYEASNRTVTWTLGTLAAGQRHGLSLRLAARVAGELVNRALAVADRGLRAEAEAPLRVEGVPALMLEVVDLEDPIEVGAETTYEIRVVNQGTCASTGVQIIATVPVGMLPRNASGPTPYRIQGQQIIFEPLARLTARADALFRVKVVGQKPGDLRFKVQLTSDQLHLPVFEEESTRVYSD